MTADYEVVGRGSDMAIRVTGPDASACLAAAVRGLAAAIGEVDPSTPRHRPPVELTGNDPADLLVSVVDEASVCRDSGLQGPILDTPTRSRHTFRRG